MLTNRKLIGAAAFTAALAAGGVAGALLGTPSLSGAQEADDTTTTAADEPSTTTESGDTGTVEEAPVPAPDGEHCGPGFGARLSVVADALGITEDELHEALADGQSIADVAEAEGVEVQTVIDALVAEATEQIDEKVADGDLTEERAAELKADLPERMTELVNREGPPFRAHRFHRGFHFGVRLEVVADAIGITLDQLEDGLQDGQSIAAIAEANDVDVEDLIDTLVADATSRIDEKVADGDLDEERAAEMKDGLEDRITDFVNREGFPFLERHAA